jgi:hypothetical protein
LAGLAVLHSFSVLAVGGEDVADVVVESLMVFFQFVNLRGVVNLFAAAVRSAKAVLKGLHHPLSLFDGFVQRPLVQLRKAFILEQVEECAHLFKDHADDEEHPQGEILDVFFRVVEHGELGVDVGTAGESKGALEGVDDDAEGR